MNLSELIYQVVRNTILYENNSSISVGLVRRYAYYLTTNQESDDGITIDSDYKKTVDNVFIAVNQAIQRVASLEKIAPKIVEAEVGEGNLIDLSSYDVNRVLNVYYDYPRVGRINLEFDKKGKKTVHLRKRLPSSISAVQVEYYPEIKKFDYEDIQYHLDSGANALSEEDDTITDEDVDLAELGISNLACSAIILYCKGILGRDVYGSEADYWVNQAEQYFLDLPDFDGEPTHEQSEIEDIYGGYYQ